MDGLREIHFGERSLSLSHLYKNDSRRCIPLLLVVAVAVDLFVGLIEPCCCCWLCGDVDETLWWELRAPRGDEGPSTSKLEYENRKKKHAIDGRLFWSKTIVYWFLIHITHPQFRAFVSLSLVFSFSGDKNTSVYLCVRLYVYICMQVSLLLDQ
jgi:hypothetical protein